MSNFRLVSKSDYGKGYPELYNQLSPTPNVTKKQFDSFIDTLNKNHNTYVLEVNNRIVACATFIIEQKLLRGLAKVLHIEDVVVDESCRGTGVGKKIIELLKEVAVEEECYKVILDCSDSYVGFYEKCGFAKKGNMMSLYFNH